MIRKITLENFKAWKHLEMECANLNLLAAVNGMGKSSVLQMMLLLRQSNEKGYLEKYGLTLKGDLTDLGIGANIFHQYSGKPEIISFEIDEDKLTESLKWIFQYQADTDVLPYDDEKSKDSEGEIATNKEPEKTAVPDLNELSLFSDKFQYLHAERWVKNQYERSDFEVIRRKNLGKHGEYATHFLVHFGLDAPDDKGRGGVHESLMYPGTITRNLLSQTSAWMGEISPKTVVKAESVMGTDQVRLRYEFEIKKGRTNEMTPTNVGFGMTYVLPVIVALLSAQPGDLLLIENPESHIHPKGQAAIGRLMALAAQQGVQLFVETHSDHILNGIRVAVKEKLIDRDKVIVSYFDRDPYSPDVHVSQRHEIRIDANGELSDYPKDFLDEWNKQLLQLI